MIKHRGTSMAKMIPAKQITPITLSRIYRLLRAVEVEEHPHKLTVEIRSDHSGCVRDEFNTVHRVWTNLDEFNDIIVEANE